MLVLATFSLSIAVGLDKQTFLQPYSDAISLKEGLLTQNWRPENEKIFDKSVPNTVDTNDTVNDTVSDGGNDTVDTNDVEKLTSMVESLVAKLTDLESENKKMGNKVSTLEDEAKNFAIIRDMSMMINIFKRNLVDLRTEIEKRGTSLVKSGKDNWDAVKTKITDIATQIESFATESRIKLKDSSDKALVKLKDSSDKALAALRVAAGAIKRGTAAGIGATLDAIKRGTVATKVKMAAGINAIKRGTALVKRKLLERKIKKIAEKVEKLSPDGQKLLKEKLGNTDFCKDEQ